MVDRLVDRVPHPSAETLVSRMVRPRHFRTATFDTYHADPGEPSQAGARARLREVAHEIDRRARRWAWPRPSVPAVYLDGGFGVGKTHLLAALAGAVGESQTMFGTFVEYTNLVGVLGFSSALEAMAGRRLVAIDEFELDDPGDTLLVSRLVRELIDRGVAVAATSNTLPESLGEGRFDAEDFLREIQGLASRFEVIRIDGPDYRRRGLDLHRPPCPDEAVAAAVAAHRGATLDALGPLVEHLGRVHPSRYGVMLDGVTAVGLTGVSPLRDQSSALRFVVLVDRLYDRGVPVVVGGDGGTLFSAEMLHGGYRKKYLRAVSRLAALRAEGDRITGPCGSAT